MEFSENLKRIRKENNLSQEQLAERLGVSRQSVSKWENGSAFPETDKIVQICDMFDISMDELFGVSTKTSSKDYMKGIEKYIKTFDNFDKNTKTKILLESLISLLVLGMLFGIMSNLLSMSLTSLFGFMPIYFRDFIDNIIGLITFIVVVAITLYLVKVRYLDKIVVIKKDKVEVENDEKMVIINDNSIFKPIANVFILFFKFILFFISLAPIGVLMASSILMVVSLMLIETGSLFVGIILGLIGTFFISISIIHSIYSFILNLSKKSLLAIYTFVFGIIFVGFGIGITAMTLTNYTFVNEFDSNYVQEKRYEFDVNEGTKLKTYGFVADEEARRVLNSYYNIDFVIDDIDNIVIDVKSNHNCITKFVISNNVIRYDTENCNLNLFNSERLVNDLKNKKIVNYLKEEITIYGNKENVANLKYNSKLN
jgi:transcriptional regulator with XRE-family HTH domain